MPRPAVPVRPAPLAPSLAAACERWRERPAVTYGGKTWSYGELAEQGARLAASYREMGVGPGDRVLCQLPNCPQHLVAVFAAWACGAVHVGVDNDLTGRELASLVERTGAAVLLFQPRADAPDAASPVEAVRQVRPDTSVIVHGAPAGRSGPGGAAYLEELLAVPAVAPVLSPPGPDDTALLLVTSGTTGLPKAVMETLPHCWAKMQFFADAFGPGPDDVELLYLPMSHVFGLRLALLPLLRGGRVVLLDRFSPEKALRLVGEEGVTVLPGMPTHFRLLLDRVDPAGHAIETLRWGISAAATLPTSLAEQIYRTLDVEIMFVYGCSEGFTMLTTDREEILRGSVGRRVFRGPPGTAPDGRVGVVDPSSRAPLPPGEVGEVVFGAARPVRYWGEPDVAVDGWYRTGDLGRMGEDGTVVLVGRLKELVNRGGLKVPAAEVEAYIARHPAIADAGVVATPDPVLGESICACVAPMAWPTQPLPSLPELRDFLARDLARHKLPDELCVVERVPRTNIGKVDRPALTTLVVDGELPRERLRPVGPPEAAPGAGPRGSAST